jgi:hypothetical protein
MGCGARRKYVAYPALTPYHERLGRAAAELCRPSLAAPVRHNLDSLLLGALVAAEQPIFGYNA